MKNSASLLAVLLLAAATTTAAEVGECPLVPVPKVYKDHGKLAELRVSEAAIVVGQGASEPERYAAERLGWLISRRFKAELPIVRENQIPEDRKQLLLLGQRTTNKLLDGLCKTKSVELSAQKPGFDGFVIEVVEDAGRRVVLIGGCNPRGVVYGAHAFFDLLRRDGTRVVFPVVSVRDWPSILWRGRPFPAVKEHLQPGVMDAYVRARVNFLDVRSDEDDWASYGFEPRGRLANEEETKRVIEEAHKRGLFVYATVKCATTRAGHALVLKTYEQLVALGADGLWISFDDPGAGEDPFGLIAKVLEWGQERGFAGVSVAVTPPGESYARVETEFNKRAARISGFNAARWFFISRPLARVAKAARAIGLKRKPSWWHNWPRIRGGLCHEGYGGRSLRADGKPAYVDLYEMTPSAPSPWTPSEWRTMGTFADNTDAVMMWGVMPPEYAATVHCFWAWEPKRFDWEGTRRAIYSWVFGRSAAGAAARFDDDLHKLKSLLILPRGKPNPGTDWPPRLRRASETSRAVALIAEMAKWLRDVEDVSRRESLLPPERLVNCFLEPMEATVEWGRRLVQMDFVEYEIPQLRRQLYVLVAFGRRDAALALLNRTRDRLLGMLPQVKKGLQGLFGGERYEEVWKKRLSSLAYWEQSWKESERRIAERFASYSRGYGLDKKCASFWSWKSSPQEGEVLEVVQPSRWLDGPEIAEGPVGVGLVRSEDGTHSALGFLFCGSTVPVDSRGEVFLRLPAKLAGEGRRAAIVLRATLLRGRLPRGACLIRLSADGKETLSVDGSEVCGKLPKLWSFRLPPPGPNEESVTLKLAVEVEATMNRVNPVFLVGSLYVLRR